MPFQQQIVALRDIARSLSGDAPDSDRIPPERRFTELCKGTQESRPGLGRGAMRDTGKEYPSRTRKGLPDSARQPLS